MLYNFCMVYTSDDPANQTPKDKQAQENLAALAARRRRDERDNLEDDSARKSPKSLTGTFNTKAQEAAAALAKVTGSDMSQQQMQQQLALLGMTNMYSDTNGVTITAATNKNIHVTKGCVSVDYDHALAADHPRNLTAVMESAIVAKAAYGDRSGCIGTNDPYTAMIMTYAAELAGLSVRNPSETKLQDAHPELAARMKGQWDNMQAKAGMDSGAGTPATIVSANADIAAAAMSNITQPLNNMGARI